jgi:hypothetical protein
MRRKRPEAALQRAVAAFLDVALPDDAWWSAVGHGGGGLVRGAQLKAMGVKAGFPDVHVLWRGIPIYIELKSTTGALSDEQKAVRDAIRKSGGLWHMARSVEQVEQALVSWGVTLRASIMKRAA